MILKEILFKLIQLISTKVVKNIPKNNHYLKELLIQYGQTKKEKLLKKKSSRKNHKDKFYRSLKSSLKCFQLIEISSKTNHKPQQNKLQKMFSM